MSSKLELAKTILHNIFIIPSVLPMRLTRPGARPMKTGLRPYTSENLDLMKSNLKMYQYNAWNDHPWAKAIPNSFNVTMRSKHNQQIKHYNSSQRQKLYRQYAEISKSKFTIVFTDIVTLKSSLSSINWPSKHHLTMSL